MTNPLYAKPLRDLCARFVFRAPAEHGTLVNEQWQGALERTGLEPEYLCEAIKRMPPHDPRIRVEAVLDELLRFVAPEVERRKREALHRAQQKALSESSTSTDPRRPRLALELVREVSAARARGEEWDEARVRRWWEQRLKEEA